jgi:Carboxypeptidase regulatory-like domain
MRLGWLATFVFLAGYMFAQSASPQSAWEYRIAGTVVSSKGGEPLSHARVVLVNTKRPQDIQTMMSTDDGHFEFRVPAGKFNLQGARKGYIPGSYEQHEQFSTAIVTGAGLNTETLKLKLSPEAVIRGKVLDERGEPIRHANVTIYREARNSGIARISAVRTDATDDEGYYELTPLPEGNYFLSVQAEPWYAVHPLTTAGPEMPSQVVDRALDVAYPITYYAEATEPDEATPIPVRGGDHLSIDFHLYPVEALHLVYHFDPSVQARGFPSLQKPGFDGENTFLGQATQMTSSGTVEMTGVPAGRYMVRLPGSNGQLQEPIEADLETDGQELETPVENTTSSIKATIQIPGSPKLPPQLRAGLRNSHGRLVAIANVDDKGVANFSDVIPGTYETIVVTNTTPYSVVKISRDDRAALGHSLVVPANATLAVTIVAVAGQATVEGQVMRGRQAFATAMVVLVPEDPDQHHELFRRDQSDLDGTFSLRNVVPGNYTLIAIEDGWDLDWAKPAVLSSYGKRGKKLTIDTPSVQVHEPVQVQPK